jgi:hypothetical protein
MTCAETFTTEARRHGAAMDGQQNRPSAGQARTGDRREALLFTAIFSSVSPCLRGELRGYA